jgi:hypothetical protein
LAAGDDFAPDFGGQGVFGRRGFVPRLAEANGGDVVDGGDFGHGVAQAGRVQAGGDFGRKRFVAAVFDGGVDVRLDVGDGERVDGVGVDGGEFVEEEGYDGVFADVIGDVLFGVVRPHLFLVDVFLEDVTEDIGVDFVVGAVGAVVEMPAVSVEEGKQPVERGVGDVEVGVLLFNLVREEDAAVEVGDFAEQLVGVGGAFFFLGSKAVEEQFGQELPVELVFAARFGGGEFVGEVIGVAVEETFLLDEIDEHEPVEHHGGVPAPVALVLDALEEFQEPVVLGLEALIELLGDGLDIELFGDTLDNGDDRDAALGVEFVEIEEQAVKFLEERVAGLAGVEGVFAEGGGLAGLAFRPEPDGTFSGGVGEDDEMLEGAFGNFPVDGLADMRGREAFIVHRLAFVDDHAALFGDGNELADVIVGANLERLAGVVGPAKFLDEELAEVEGLEGGASALEVEFHGRGRRETKGTEGFMGGPVCGVR